MSMSMNIRDYVKVYDNFLDKKLCSFYKFYKYTTSSAYALIYKRELEKLIKLDDKRKQIRNKLK